MACTTCKETVIANPTGICLACQRGFSKDMQEDHYLNNCRVQSKDYYHPGESKDLKSVQEKIDAIEKRIKQIDDKQEHQDRKTFRKEH